MTCSQCQSQNLSSYSFCHACGTALEQAPDIADARNGKAWNQAIQIPWARVGLSLGGLALLVSCFFHIVWINGVPTPVQRLSPGLAEPTSSLEAISGMPWFAATSQYPLTVQALQQAGYLESDAARQERIENQVHNDMQSQMQEIRDRLGY